MTDKISKRMRLKDNHPTMAKLNKLYDLAEEIGLSLTFVNARAVIVHDNDRDPNLPDLFMEDLEEGHEIETWPPTFEYMVVYDNPAYLAEEKRLYKEYTEKRQAELDRLEAERLAKEKAEQERREREIELKERAELARLQKKYRG